MKHVLTIAGSDTCGGAGIQADLKTFSAQGTYGMSVITAVTVQNTQGVFGCQDIDPEIIKGQIDAIFTDIEVSAVKIGMVSQIPTIHAIADKLEQYQPKNVVLDPVMISKSGFDLMQPEAKEALITRLIPLAYVITPNLPEAEVITGLKINDLASMEQAARAIHKMGAKNVLIKGGHLEDDATDLLFDGENIVTLHSDRINTKNTHGTGCTMSSCIAANLAKAEADMAERSVKEEGILVIRGASVFGFDTWYGKKDGNVRVASSWQNPVVVALYNEGNIIIGTPCAEVAEEMFGENGLKKVYAKLNELYGLTEGNGFGGHVGIGGSPRNMRMSYDDVKNIALVLNHYRF